MVQIKIYYSLRKNGINLPTLKLFADEECAIVDQEIFKFWEKPCYGSFPLDVKGTAYIDLVETREEYLTELEKLGIPNKILNKLKR